MRKNIAWLGADKRTMIGKERFGSWGTILVGNRAIEKRKLVQVVGTLNCVDDLIDFNVLDIEHG